MYFATRSTSRLTGSPAYLWPSAVRSSDCFLPSAVNDSASDSTTVGHTPLTAIESPGRASAVTVVAATATRAPDPRRVRPVTVPSSSTIPVNTARLLLAGRSAPAGDRRVRLRKRAYGPVRSAPDTPGYRAPARQLPSGLSPSAPDLHRVHRSMAS